MPASWLVGYSFLHYVLPFTFPFYTFLLSLISPIPFDSFPFVFFSDLSVTWWSQHSCYRATYSFFSFLSSYHRHNPLYSTVFPSDLNDVSTSYYWTTYSWEFSSYSFFQPLLISSYFLPFSSIPQFPFHFPQLFTSMIPPQYRFPIRIFSIFIIIMSRILNAILSRV